MGDVNRVFLMGRVCQPISFVYDEHGEAHARFQLVVHRPRRGRGPDGQAREDRKDYPWIVCRGNLAEQVRGCCDLGTRVHVEGLWQTRNYTEPVLRGARYCPGCGRELSERDAVQKDGRMEYRECSDCHTRIPVAYHRTAQEVYATSCEFIDQVRYPQRRTENAAV